MRPGSAIRSARSKAARWAWPATAPSAGRSRCVRVRSACASSPRGGRIGARRNSNIVRAGSIAELAALSDHLLLALPLTDATRHCIDAAVLEGARPGLHLINIARGGLVDQSALLAAFDADQLGFATLDVTEPEPLPADHPIYTHPRIRLTPHLSWSGQASRTRLTEQIIVNLSAYARGEALRDLVDPIRGY